MRIKPVSRLPAGGLADLLLPVGLFTLVDVALGVWPGPIMDLIGRIAGGLL